MIASTVTCFLILGALGLSVLVLIFLGFSTLEAGIFIKRKELKPKVVGVKTAIKRYAERKQEQLGTDEVTPDEIELIKRNQLLRKAEISQSYKMSSVTKCKITLWVLFVISILVFGICIFCILFTPAGQPINIVSAITALR